MTSSLRFICALPLGMYVPVRFAGCFKDIIQYRILVKITSVKITKIKNKSTKTNMVVHHSPMGTGADMTCLNLSVYFRIVSHSLDLFLFNLFGEN